ncbi:MAG: hypothetical protein D3923_07180 [Candidatus Electrothrix sp. AR3]|nr:hypothetical protein [Candidatus Electrothrix sp. AR3]
MDVGVNGFDKNEKIQELREQRADYMYKPSTELDKKHPQLYLRARGVSLEKFLQKYRWGGKVIRSFYGVYGHMTVSDTTSYYTLMRNSGFLFLGFLFLTVLLRGNGEQRLLLFNLTICTLGLIIAAGYASWTKDLQAQGRYMLVILPMLGMLIAQTEQLFQALLFRSFVAFMFIFSLYNFIFIGLASPIL